jgi:hypothetical protein
LPAGELMLIHFVVAAVSSILFPFADFHTVKFSFSMNAAYHRACRQDVLCAWTQFLVALVNEVCFVLFPSQVPKAAFFNNVRRFDVME